MKYAGKICLVILLTLTACAAPWKTNLMTGVRADAELIKEVKPAPEYCIQPGDELSVMLRTLSHENAGPLLQLLGENQTDVMSGGGSGLAGSSRLYTYSVNANGEIDIPYVGKVDVKGLTLLQTKQLLEKRLFDLVKQCSVEVSLVNNYFTAMGEFGTGKIPLPKEQTNIYEALALTGKITDVGDRTRVKLIRQTSDGPVIKTFNLRSKEIISSEYFWIQPNDIIYIQPREGQFFGVHSTVYSILGLLTAVASIAALGIKLAK
ncbi:MAG: polysaccharide biosynthesis/export family protein [Bacteroidota bacterium]|nr:polysaccharide biosynthesis/export family protein [Bacteroidota bacterium]